MCFALPKITYLLRTTPTWLCAPEISSFDSVLKSAVESVLNVCLSKSQWGLASQPIRYGGLGIRCAGDVGLPAFLASAHGVANLVAIILHSDGDRASIPYVSEAVDAWSVLNNDERTPMVPQVQRAWDEVGAKSAHKRLLDSSTGASLARLRALSQSESGAWLHALPSPHLGTLLDDDSLRVAVALRLGCKVCEPHKCICGSMVEADGHHALSCRRCTGRFPRHHALNDIVRRAFISSNVPCVLEPPGLSRSDGKRPDGLTLVPWKNGKCLVWDATCVNTVAASHLGRSVLSPAAAAEDAACRKRLKYAALEGSYYFVPFAVETMGSWGADAKRLVREIGQRIKDGGGDSRAGLYLVQRLSIAIQRGNAASISGTFAPEVGTARYLWEWTKRTSRAERVAYCAALAALVLCGTLAGVLAGRSVPPEPDVAPHEWNITRQMWLADPEPAPLEVDFKPVWLPLRLVVVQHTAGLECYRFDACAAVMRVLQHTRLINFGYDVQYNFVIGNDGRVYEGRGWFGESAHKFDINRCSLGVGFTGDYRRMGGGSRASPLQLNHTQLLLDAGVRDGMLHERYVILAACDLKDTVSPGDELYDALHQLPHFIADPKRFRNRSCEDIYSELQALDDKPATTTGTTSSIPAHDNKF